MNLLKAIDSALQLAGWKREKTAGTIVLKVYGDNVELGVPAGYGTGVAVFVDSSIPSEQLNLEPHGMWPLSVRAATELQSALNSSITPSQADVLKSATAETTPNPSPLVRIMVGKKP